MQAYKLKAKVDHTGKLIITEPINLIPGDVEIIVLQSKTKIENNQPYQEKQFKNRPSKVKAFQNWFAKTEPTASDLDANDAKWEYLKEKHYL